MTELPLRFRARIELAGINPYVPVSAAHAAKIRPGWRKPMPVRVRVNGKPDTPWRINLMPMGDGAFYLYLHARVRAESRTAVGDIVAVEIEFDAAYRGGPMHPMPPAFRRGLEADPRARHAWNALPPSRRKEVLRYVAALKSEVARERNITKALHVLAGAAGRFMARDWNPEDAPVRRKGRAAAK